MNSRNTDMSSISVHAPTLFIFLLFLSECFIVIRPQQVNPFAVTGEDFDSEDTDDNVSFPSDDQETSVVFNAVGRISELKCREYSRLFMQTVQVIPLVTNPKPVSLSVASCDNSVPLIVGGEEARPGEFPHMAALGYVQRHGRRGARATFEWQCGGTLISEQFVMTAAHCIQPQLARVRLGALRLSAAGGEELGVAQTIVHPQYRPPSKYNDLALIRLSRPVRLTRSIVPACLIPAAGATAPPIGIATGWGHTTHAGSPSDKLMKVALTVIPNNECGRYYERVPNRQLDKGIAPTLMCAGEREGGKDACQGDSGGPLQVARTDGSCLYDVIGVTSFGKGCANSNSPGVYSRVSQFVPWIESIVWPR